MIHYIATIEDSQVKSLRLTTGDNPAEGLQEDGTTIVHIDFPIENRMHFIETNYWDGEWKERPKAPNTLSSWDGEKWTWDHEELMTQIRGVRNTLLAKSDWTQMPDSPLSEDDKVYWQIYREELRDLSFVKEGVSNVDDVEWPTRPE